MASKQETTLQAWKRREKKLGGLGLIIDGLEAAATGAIFLALISGLEKSGERYRKHAAKKSRRGK